MAKEKLISERPWGRFAQYCQNESCTVKIIEVAPMGKLSIQRHKERDELWIALDGGLLATVGDKQILMSPSLKSEVWIPRGTIHSVENRNYEVSRFLEVSFGHFDEEDIERIADKYGRV